MSASSANKSSTVQSSSNWFKNGDINWKHWDVCTVFQCVSRQALNERGFTHHVQLTPLFNWQEGNKWTNYMNIKNKKQKRFLKAPQCSRSVWTNMIIVVLHINTYLQPSTFCTNPYKYDLSCFERSLQTHEIWCSMDQPHSFVFCFVFLFFFLLLFGLCIGILFIS